MEALEASVRRTIDSYWSRVHPEGPFPEHVVLAMPLPRDQGKNHAAIAAAFAAFSAYDDLTPWTMQPLLEGAFALRRDFGIDPEPLCGFNSPAAAADLFRETFRIGIDDAPVVLDSLIESLGRIESQCLLGKRTINKLVYVRELTGFRLKDLSAERLIGDPARLAALIDHTLELLRRHIVRLPPGHPRNATVEQLLRDWEDYKALFALHKLFAGYPQFKGRAAAFYTIFADVVVDAIATRHGLAGAAYPASLHYLRRRGIEAVFSRRDKDFVFSGDTYGDCTAHRVRSQVDDRIANIHWTVYAWLFDPYYRVIEVFLDGKRAIKCHILPLKIQDRPLLMLDAIEVVPHLRERKDGRPNADLDAHLYENRFALLGRLFEICGDIASRMALDTIYVEKFSNAKWVRDEIERLPDDSYHIDDVEKLYGDAIVAANIRRFTDADPGEISEEIQAKNPWLMHRQMRRNYKDVAVLRGRREGWSLRISGP